MCLHGYPQFSQNELILVSLVPCHSLNQGCKRFLKHFHASCQQNKTFFNTVRLDWFRRLYMLIIHQKVAHAFNEIELNVTNLEIAHLCHFVFERKILS